MSDDNKTQTHTQGQRYEHDDSKDSHNHNDTKIDIPVDTEHHTPLKHHAIHHTPLPAQPLATQSSIVNTTIVNTEPVNVEKVPTNTSPTKSSQGKRVMIYHIDHIDEIENDRVQCGHPKVLNAGVQFTDSERSVGTERGFMHPYDACDKARIEYPETHQPHNTGTDNTQYHSHGPDPNRVIKIKHHDHYDVLIGNRLHFVHDDHCDDHGRVEVLRGDNAQKNVKTWHKMIRLWRFFIMSFLTGGFLIVELIVGIAIQSLALQADAFHMFSDLVALGMAFYATLISDRRENDKATFGMPRAEIIGGLMNAVFLLASCFFITLDAIQRFVEYESNHVDANQINTLIIIGAVGLFINLFGAVIFGSDGSGHGHSHGGHGHSHGNHDHTLNQSHAHEHAHGHGQNHAHEHAQSHGQNHAHGQTSEQKHSHSHGDPEAGTHAHKKCCNALRFDNKNIRALFIHIVGDALGSVGVIISGLIIKYVDSDYRWLADPAISMFIVLLIMISAVPLIRECVRILMHMVPKHIDLKELRTKIYKLKGVQDAHHLHVWPLNDSKIVASVHLKIDQHVDVEDIMLKVEKLFHEAGIHSTTIQFETVDHADDTVIVNECTNLICDHERCKKDVCCDNKHQEFLVDTKP